MKKDLILGLTDGSGKLRKTVQDDQQKYEVP
jgi:hypothetical protein